MSQEGLIKGVLHMIPAYIAARAGKDIKSFQVTPEQVVASFKRKSKSWNRLEIVRLQLFMTRLENRGFIWNHDSRKGALLAFVDYHADEIDTRLIYSKQFLRLVAATKPLPKLASSNRRATDIRRDVLGLYGWFDLTNRQLNRLGADEIRLCGFDKKTTASLLAEWGK